MADPANAFDTIGPRDLLARLLRTRPVAGDHSGAGSSHESSDRCSIATRTGLRQPSPPRLGVLTFELLANALGLVS